MKIPPLPLRGCRVLITGATGFIGSHLVPALAAEGALVWAVTRKTGELMALNHGVCTYVTGDLHDVAQARSVFAEIRPTLVYHLAAHPDGKESYEQGDAAVRGNILLTLSCLEASHASGAQAFIYGDSTKVYGHSPVPYRADMPVQPLSSYAIAKAAGWEMCELYRRLHGMATVSVRPTIVYGPGQGYNLFSATIQSAARGEPVKLLGGTQTRDPLYIDDAVRAFLAAGQMAPAIPGAIVNVGGGHERSVAELAKITLEVFGADANVECSLATMRPTDTQRSYCDNLEAAELLGWTPNIDIRTGLSRTIDQFLSPRRRAAALSANRSWASLGAV